MPIHPTLSVVVPVYNGSETLALLCQRLGKVLDEIGGRSEIVLVNDGSADGSWGVIRELAQGQRGVVGINLMRNYGQHNAMLCGIRAAKGEVIVTLDDDLQNPPEEIPKLLAKLEEGYDVVYGKREREQHGLWRNLASQATKTALQGAMGASMARSVSSYRCFRARLRDAFATHQSSSVCIDVLLTWATVRFAAVTVRHEPRRAGASNYSVGRLATHALNMMTGFSALPLRFASFLGFALTLFGLGILIYVIGVFLFNGRAVPGFTFLASTIAIFSGAQLFALGIIGEYLARMHFRMLDRPTYAIQEYALPSRRTEDLKPEAPGVEDTGVERWKSGGIPSGESKRREEGASQRGA